MVVKECLHCQLPALEESEFCCAGCEAAYGFIHKMGFGGYYENRILGVNEISLKPSEVLDESDIEEFLHENNDGSFSAHLFVKGLHCGACIWLIESILRRQEGVKIARINMSNRKLHLSWIGEKTLGSKFIKIINGLGYCLVPYDHEELLKEEKKYSNDLLKALCIAGFGAGNVMLMSVALWSSSQEKMGVMTHNFLYWLSAAIALPVIIYSGRVFFKSAFKAIKARSSNMDVPISVAIIITTIVSLFEVVAKADHAYFDSAVMLVFFLLIGRYLDFITRKKAMSVSRDFSLLNAISAVIVGDDGKNKVILAKNIKKNMILRVAVGDRIAADGIVVDGESELDTALITGESLPQKVIKNGKVFAGMINVGAAILVKVNVEQKDSLIAKISSLVENLEANKGKFVRIADRVSRYYTPVVHLLALTTFLGWYFVFGLPFRDALLIGVAVLIITCPCALALAVPIVNVLAHSKLLKKGIVVKSGEALEKLNLVDKVVFDKTGTLTLGKPVLQSAILIEDGKELILKQDDEMFLLAASVAKFSNHPLSVSVANAFKGKLLNVKVEEILNNGLKANFDGKEVKIGKKEFVLGVNELKVNKDDKNPQVFVKFGEKIAIFTFSDPLKDDVREVVSALRGVGKEVILLSGDRRDVVQDVADKLGIDKFYWSKDPIEKADIIKNFKNKGGNVLMVGDGINDAAPISASDVGISMSEASDIAKNCADVIIQGDRLGPLIEVLETSRRSGALIKRNFMLSFAYNIIAVPFAIFGFVTPLIAALSMSASSVVVVLNSLRINSKRIK